MALFLQVMGVVFLVILGVVAIPAAFLVLKFGLFLRGVNKLVTEIATAHPPEIKLVEVVDGRWDDEAAKTLARPLPGLGFTEVGFFEVAEVLGGIRLQAWVRTDQGVYAAIYRSPVVGVWMDFVTKYADGTSLTLSNSPHGGKQRQRPGQENIYYRELDAEGLHHKAMTIRPDKPVRALTPADFRGDFERAYAEEMRWRAADGDEEPEGGDVDIDRHEPPDPATGLERTR